ncbi:MAG: hypothetical protein IPI04_15875 [Ignavibacteria bacterium]|nr:hypothetical protein [Ignavibacteria bacterium]
MYSKIIGNASLKNAYLLSSVILFSLIIFHLHCFTLKLVSIANADPSLILMKIRERCSAIHGFETKHNKRYYCLQEEEFGLKSFISLENRVQSQLNSLWALTANKVNPR